MGSLQNVHDGQICEIECGGSLLTVIINLKLKLGLAKVTANAPSDMIDLFFLEVQTNSQYDLVMTSILIEL